MLTCMRLISKVYDYQEADEVLEHKEFPKSTSLCDHLLEAHGSHSDKTSVFCDQTHQQQTSK